MTTVQILSRDLSNGQFRAYKEHSAGLNWKYRFGLKLVSLVHSEYIQRMPDRIHHSMILVNGSMFEYTVDGLLCTREYSISTIPDIRCLQQVNISSVSEKDWESWLRSPEVQKKYQRSSYDNVNNNCNSFVKASCEFLEIPFPIELDQFQQWLGEHSTIINTLGFCSGFDSMNGNKF